ncbi:hypothetical protein GCN74_05290 [Janthinobacterium sp. FT14W]|uniref:hypothetical protein n=1 Tax=Janthinobacterium sp. FT14W TaxID=2654253 RepID=UPI001264CA10|nr:hypothetical protein [Janthinobacterium sp. FT14W]KAB8061481.1 hypothetical protein GCN74_05290 [Janthinobacterium sp. FT14W]
MDQRFIAAAIRAIEKRCLPLRCQRSCCGGWYSTGKICTIESRRAGTDIAESPQDFTTQLMAIFRIEFALVNSQQQFILATCIA